jgi:hypothetical protein
MFNQLQSDTFLATGLYVALLLFILLLRKASVTLSFRGIRVFCRREQVFTSVLFGCSDLYPHILCWDVTAHIAKGSR